MARLLFGAVRVYKDLRVNTARMGDQAATHVEVCVHCSVPKPIPSHPIPSHPIPSHPISRAGLWQICDMRIVRERLGLDRHKLIALASLVGTDYDMEGTRGLGPVAAVTLVRQLWPHPVGAPGPRPRSAGATELQAFFAAVYDQPIDDKLASMAAGCTACSVRDKM
jgi:hypothetical protein